MESKNLIMMTSITNAMKAKDVLSKKGIRAEIVRTPKRKAKSGCGYSLYVPKNYQKAVSIIKASGIRIMGTLSVAEGEDK